MAGYESYPPSLVLGQLSHNLRKDHPDLRVVLPRHSIEYDEALVKVIGSVQGLDDRLLLPTVDPIRRNHIRRLASEGRGGLMLDKNRSPSSTASKSVRPIRTSGRLQHMEFPDLPSPERRAAIKENLRPQDMSKSGDPYPILLRCTVSEDKLPAVSVKCSVSAVDWEEGMPSCEIQQEDALWDTGAAYSFITKDIFPEEFQHHLSDDVNSAYQNKDGTRVQMSLLVEFTNTAFRVDTIAIVVDRLPNFRRGLILGQHGCIDRIMYQSVPRLVLEADSKSVDSDIWGEFNLQKYMDVDDSMINL